MRTDKPHSSVVDLLSANFRADGEITRDNGAFEIITPWAIARFGELRLAAGWWTFECDCDAAGETIEVRLSSAEDPLILFKGAEEAGLGSHARIYLRTPRNFHIALQVSGWPGRFEFRKLQLRRHTLQEDVQLVAGGLARLTRTPAPFAKLAHLVNHLAAGRTVGMSTRSLALAETGAVRASGALNGGGDVEGPDGQSGITRSSRRETHGGLEVLLGQKDAFDPASLLIVENMFAAQPQLRAAYCDVVAGGVVEPRPGWDRELAKSWDFGGPPLFFRNREAFDVHAEGGLTAIGRKWGNGAVALLPLPLVRRPKHTDARLAPAAVPVLARRPPVSIVIPTKIRIELLDKCLAGLAESTDYPELEVVVVDNGSTDPRLAEVLERAGRSLDIVCHRDPREFNFSGLINAGVAKASHDLLVLLNDDVEPVDPNWLVRMVDSLMQPDVGCVGARLTYPDGTIQHAGVTMGVGGVCGHLFKGLSPLRASRNASVIYPGQREAVTGACLGVRRAVFNEAGGLDEALAVALNDIDFCLRIRRLGYRNIYRGDVVLVHHESQSRGEDSVSEQKRRRLTRETEIFMERWRAEIEHDPYVNPQFDLATEAGVVRAMGFATSLSTRIGAARRPAVVAT